MVNLLFTGNGNDAEKHIKNCKIKGCKICRTLKEFLQRIEEDEMEKIR